MAREVNDVRLDYILKKVKQWRSYFTDNIERFHRLKRFVLKDNLDAQQRQNLGEIQKPPFTFNVTESYISRLRGEFSKHEPSFVVTPNPDGGYIAPGVAQLVEGNLMHKLYESRTSGVEYNVYTDQLCGGWGVVKVMPEFESPYTFNQTIKISRCFDPTMVGFDVLAQEPSKSDGTITFEIIPMTHEAFKLRYPDVDVTQISGSNFGDYSWSYKMGDEKIVLVCEAYVKKEMTKSLVYLANNVTLLESDYNKLTKAWNEKTIAQPPKIIKKRKSKITVICRYECINDRILDESETDWRFLPHVFFDGNSTFIRDDGANSDMVQFTRPYHYHAMDAQRLKNISGQTLANELEGLVQAKYIAPLEGIPKDYIDAYTNIQKPANLIYRAFKENSDTPIPPPQPVNRAAIPPEVMGTFQTVDQTIQNILGAFNTQLGVNNNDISGAAIVEAMTQSNATGMPYIVNFMLGWNQVAKIYLDLFPKIYTTPRTVQVIDQMRGTKSVPINGFGGQGTNVSYGPDTLMVEVKAGMNFEVQKNRAVMQMGMLSQAFPAFAQLVNTKALPILIDNLDFRGADQMKQLAAQMMQEQAQSAAQGANAPNPITLKMQDLAMRNQHKMADIQLDAAKLRQDQLKMTMDYVGDQQAHALDVAKLKTELAVHGNEMVNEDLNRLHNIVHKNIDHAHAIHQAETNRSHEEQNEPKQEPKSE